MFDLDLYLSTLATLASDTRVMLAGREDRENGGRTMATVVDTVAGHHARQAATVVRAEVAAAHRDIATGLYAGSSPAAVFEAGRRLAAIRAGCPNGCGPDCIHDDGPRCDICARRMDDSPAGFADADWNGETGNHATCELDGDAPNGSRAEALDRLTAFLAAASEEYERGERADIAEAIARLRWGAEPCAECGRELDDHGWHADMSHEYAEATR